MTHSFPKRRSYDLRTDTQPSGRLQPRPSPRTQGLDPRPGRRSPRTPPRRPVVLGELLGRGTLRRWQPNPELRRRRDRRLRPRLRAAHHLVLPPAPALGITRRARQAAHPRRRALRPTARTARRPRLRPLYPPPPAYPPPTHITLHH